MSKLNTALSGLTVDNKKLTSLSTALNSLSSVQKASGFSSTVNALKNLSNVSKELSKTDLSKFASQMNQVANAIRPLATEMEKVSAGFRAFPIRIQKLISSNTGLAASNKATGNSFGFLGVGISSVIAKIGIYGYTLKRTVGSWITSYNDYVENVNLFTVAMGKFADESMEYAERVQSAMGIDLSEWIRNQSVLMDMVKGYGVVEDKAKTMSEGLTQLIYDYASFYNIGIEESAQKVQSAIAGEIEPVRRLGKDLSVATLQQYAYKYGIDQSVNSMTQAQKAQLRYVALIDQSKSAMGDMARTIQTPANAMRILQQQVQQLTRALGSLFIPILQVVIPWVQAFVSVLTDAARAIAGFFGVELPTIDYSGMDNIGTSAGAATDEIEDTTGALGDAAAAAKKLKDYTLGFDELNILNPDTGTASGGIGGSGGASGGSYGGDLDLPILSYDFLGGLEEKTNQLKESIEAMVGPIASIAAGLAAWKIASKVLKWFSDLKQGKFDKINKIAAGIGLMVTGFSLEWQGAYDIGYNGLNFENGLKTLIGSALGIAGSLLVFGTGPVGWTIGILAALTIGITSFAIGYNRRKIDDEIKKRFGEITLSVEEAKEYAEKIMSSPLSVQLDVYIEAKENAQQAIENYMKSTEQLSYLTWKVSLGFEVDKSEIEESINSLVSDAQTALNSQKERYTLAISMSFTDADIQSDMAKFVNEYFAQSEGDMARLGEELKAVMLNALADGVLDDAEMKTISDLQNEMNQIMATVADAEYKAKLTNTVYVLDGNLSYDSVKTVSEELQVLAQEQLDNIDTVHLDALAAIELKYKSDGDYSAYVAAIEDEMKAYSENVATVSVTAFQPLVEKFNTAFSDALSESQSAFSTPVNELLTYTFQQFNTDETGVLVEGSISDFMISVQTRWQDEFSRLDVTPETKAALSETLAALKPSAEQLQQIADDAKAAGQKVPDSISDGLHDYYSLAAVSGDLDAINYLLGEKLSTDPNFLGALQTATDAGETINSSIARGLLDNVEIKNNADGTISLINDTIGEKVVEITPELVETLEALGVDVSNGLLDGAQTQNSANLPEWKQLGNDALSGFGSAISGAFQIGANIAQEALRGFRSKQGIDSHSPSKAFERLGLDSASGFQNGLSSILDVGKNIGGRLVKQFSLDTFSFGGFPTPGQLFVANEPGNPEMIGSIGGRTAVANNEQITEAIAAAVYNAVVSAQAQQADRPIQINETINLDGRAVYRNQRQVEQAQGYRMTTSTIPV